MARFQGKRGRHAVILTLYDSGNYLLQHDWRLSPRELGVTSSREVGCHSTLGDELELVSEDTTIRFLRKSSDGSFLLIEKSEAAKIDNSPLNGFLLQRLQ